MKLMIESPPKEKGLFQVIYAIDIPAKDAQQAAETVFKMMQSKDAFAAILVVIDSKGRQTVLDLADILEFNRITPGFVCQKFRRKESGRFVCIDQEFVAGEQSRQFAQEIGILNNLVTLI